MTLKEEILGLSGHKDPILTEGVKFFRFSKRIEKVIQRVSKSKNEKMKKQMIDFLQKAKADFIEAESAYSSGNTAQGIKLYETAKAKNAVAVKKVMSNEMKSFVVRAGVFGIVAGLLFVLTKGAIDAGKFDKIFNNIEHASKNMVNELKYLGREKDSAYYNAKWDELVRSKGESARIAFDKAGKELLEKTDYIKKSADNAVEEVTKVLDRNMSGKKIDGKKIDDYITGKTDEERGFPPRRK